MKTLIIGTGNKNKVAEIVPLMKGIEVDLRLATTYGHFDPEENGSTLEENAIIKAKAAMELSGEWAFSDDTGIYVDALDGRPGIYAARYAGKGCEFIENVKKVLRELEGVPETKRTATFATVIAFCRPGHEPRTFRGECTGRILTEFRGSAGFGYDPIFQLDGLDKTFAEMSQEEKNSLSHRAKAMKLFTNILPMTMACDVFIAEYIKKHPEIIKAEWLPEYKDLTLWLRDTQNPEEPFSKNEFIQGTVTWLLFDKLEQILLSIPE